VLYVLEALPLLSKDDDDALELACVVAGEDEIPT
jgi:hypothetical protein